MSFFAELKRRNVFRVGAAYVVVGWLVIQVAETIFPLFGFDDTPARIVVIVLAIGIIPTVIFAWAFELTPEGLKKESEIDRTQSITPHTGKKLDRMIMVGLAVALGYFAFDKFVLSESREATIAADAKQQGRTEALVESYGEKSIAVLPFVNMSSDEEQEYFSDGISEELLNLLAKIPELRVISRSSAFSFKGKDLELTEIAKRLDVAHILEGSVRKAGNRVRITAQLIEARSDTHLWSETYDRELDDIFAIQDEISATVVAQLKITLLGEAPKVAETDPEAYALYLQARHLSRLGTAEGHEQSIALNKQALAIDPNYAAAWSGLAMNYVNQEINGLLSAGEGYRLARPAAAKALTINPDFAHAHSVLGGIAIRGDNNLAQAARHFERSLQLDPADPALINNAAGLVLTLGRVDESIALYQRVVAHDPVNSTTHFNLGLSYLFAGRWDDAIASLETALRLSPGMLGAHHYIGMALLMKGELEAALESFSREEGVEVFQVKGEALALYALGRIEEHQAKLNELIERWGDERPSQVAHVYAYMGDTDRAFAWLDKLEQEEGGAFLPTVPFWQPLADDPRWLPLLESIGKSPEQLAAIEFEVKLPAQ